VEPRQRSTPNRRRGRERPVSEIFISSVNGIFWFILHTVCTYRPNCAGDDLKELHPSVFAVIVGRCRNYIILFKILRGLVPGATIKSSPMG